MKKLFAYIQFIRQGREHDMRGKVRRLSENTFRKLIQNFLARDEIYVGNRNLSLRRFMNPHREFMFTDFDLIGLRQM